LVAFSPVLVEMASQFTADNSRYTLLAGLLLALALWLAPPNERRIRPNLGGTLLALGLLAEVFGIVSASSGIARVGLPVAALGVAFIDGRPRAAIVVLAFGLVPIPSFVHGITSPDLESLLGAAAARVLALLGLSIEVGGPLLRSGSGRLELLASDVGLVTALCCAGVGWYSAVRGGGNVRLAAVRALGGAALGLLLHAVLLLLCVATLAIGLPGLGRFLLTHGTWLALAAGVLWYELHSRPRAGRE
jgi:hypothetical protein